MNLFDTRDVTAADFSKKVGHYQDEALRHPVLISEDGQPRTVLLAYEEFARLRASVRRACTLDAIPDDIAEAILRARVPDELEDYEP